MKHKVSELEGALLDLGVAMAEAGVSNLASQSTYWLDPQAGVMMTRVLGDCGYSHVQFRPSTEWNDGGPIIEREGICLMKLTIDPPTVWSANFELYFNEGGQEDPHTGSTPLIAAMRAYVASKLGGRVGGRAGEEVELP